MENAVASIKDGGRVWELLSRIIGQALHGGGRLSGAEAVSDSYERKTRYKTADERARAIVRHHSLLCGTVGAATGIGGLITLPVSLPADVAGTLFIQARMVGAVAYTYNHDLDDDTMILLIALCMLGGQGVNVLKDIAEKTSVSLSVKAISRIPGTTLTKINQMIGMRFVTKFGSTGVINLGKLVPFIGPTVCGAIDYGMCRFVGRVAIGLLGSESGDLLTIFSQELPTISPDLEPVPA